MTQNEFINSGFITKINELLVGAKNKKKEITEIKQKLEEAKLFDLIKKLPNKFTNDDLKKINNKITDLQNVTKTDLDTKLEELKNELEKIKEDNSAEDRANDKNNLIDQIKNIVDKHNNKIKLLEYSIENLEKIIEFEKLTCVCVKAGDLKEHYNKVKGLTINDDLSIIKDIYESIFKDICFCEERKVMFLIKEKQEKRNLENITQTVKENVINGIENKINDNNILIKLLSLVFLLLIVFAVYNHTDFLEKKIIAFKYIFYIFLFVILVFIIVIYQRIIKLSDEKREIEKLLYLSRFLDSKSFKHNIETYLKNKLRN